MATTDKEVFNPDMIGDLFEGFDAEQVGDMPSFEPFPVGTYRNLGVEISVSTSGSAETKDFWKRIDIDLVLKEDTEVELANADDVLPADGSKSSFTYTIAKYDELTGKVINTTTLHQAKGRDGSPYEAKGSYANINKDFILSSGGQVEAKNIPALFKMLGEVSAVNAQLSQRVGKANPDTGVKPVYQNISKIEYVI